jgi:hypothetical protein
MSLEDVRRLQSGKAADREHRLVHQSAKQLGKLGRAAVESGRIRRMTP